MIDSSKTRNSLVEPEVQSPYVIERHSYGLRSCTKHTKECVPYFLNPPIGSVPDKRGVSGQKPDKAGFLTRQTEW